jgi:hypothetical protein
MLCGDYRTHHTDGYGYSRFCELYRDWRKTISPGPHRLVAGLAINRDRHQSARHFVFGRD